MRDFQDENGNVITAINDIQADAFERAGFTEVGAPQKRTRKEQVTE